MKNTLEDILDEYADSRKTEGVKQPAAKPAAPVKAAHKPAEKPKKPVNTERRKRIACGAKWAAVFGGLFALVVFWQLTDQMAASAAVPSMCVCAALGGYGVGKNVG